MLMQNDNDNEQIMKRIMRIRKKREKRKKKKKKRGKGGKDVAQAGVFSSCR